MRLGAGVYGSQEGEEDVRADDDGMLKELSEDLLSFCGDRHPIHALFNAFDI